jgi:hypothetical protein
MALARCQLVVTDEAGNVVDGASIEVRRETTGSLAPVYSNRAGTVALGNPYVAADGAEAGFFAAGGAYKITATKGDFERIWRYVGVGTAQETDSANPIGIVPCNVSGTANALVLTPLEGSITELTDGMLFTCIPDFTSTTASTITIQVDATSAKALKAPDGYTNALWFDVQKSMPLTIRYADFQDVFVIQNPPHSFKQSLFGHGRVKLQASG